MASPGNELRAVRPKSRRATGFTLVEVLVVLLIMGLMVTVVVPNIRLNEPAAAAETEARRLSALIELGLQEAILRSRTLGLLVQQDSYEFVDQTDDGSWRALDDDALRRRTLPDTVALELRVEQFELPDSLDKGDTPQILLLSNGELTPFRIELTTPEGDTRYSVQGSGNGRVQWSETDRTL